MQLVEQGRLELDSPVAKYLPYFELNDKRFASITVRHLLTHTSGMPDVEDYHWDKPEYDDGSLERHVRSLRERSLLWAPGTKFAYSNLGYEVLGDLVAKVSGKSFEDYVEANILVPLDMTSSTLLLTKTDPARLATGHTRDEHGQAMPVACYPYNRRHTPSSNLHSNVADMAKWAAANMNRGEFDGHRILRTSSFDEIWSESKLFRVGISWFFDDHDGQQVVWHNGSDTGFQTLVKLLPRAALASSSWPTLTKRQLCRSETRRFTLPSGPNSALACEQTIGNCLRQDESSLALLSPRRRRSTDAARCLQPPNPRKVGLTARFIVQTRPPSVSSAQRVESRGGAVV